jgi:hypothetical protein
MIDIKEMMNMAAEAPAGLSGAGAVYYLIGQLSMARHGYIEIVLRDTSVKL